MVPSSKKGVQPDASATPAQEAKPQASGTGPAEQTTSAQPLDVLAVAAVEGSAAGAATSTIVEVPADVVAGGSDGAIGILLQHFKDLRSDLASALQQFRAEQERLNQHEFDITHLTDRVDTLRRELVPATALVEHEQATLGLHEREIGSLKNRIESLGSELASGARPGTVASVAVAAEPGAAWHDDALRRAFGSVPPTAIRRELGRLPGATSPAVVARFQEQVLRRVRVRAEEALVSTEPARTAGDATLRNVAATTSPQILEVLDALTAVDAVRDPELVDSYRGVVHSEISALVGEFANGEPSTRYVRKLFDQLLGQAKRPEGQDDSSLGRLRCAAGLDDPANICSTEDEAQAARYRTVAAFVWQLYKLWDETNEDGGTLEYAVDRVGTLLEEVQGLLGRVRAILDENDCIEAPGCLHTLEREVDRFAGLVVQGTRATLQAVREPALNLAEDVVATLIADQNLRTAKPLFKEIDSRLQDVHEVIAGLPPSPAEG